jgi:hypothetical protein
MRSTIDAALGRPKDDHEHFRRKCESTIDAALGRPKDDHEHFRRKCESTIDAALGRPKDDHEHFRRKCDQRSTQLLGVQGTTMSLSEGSCTSGVLAIALPMIAWLAASFALLGELASPAALACALGGAAAGVLVGALVARSRVRLAVLLVGALAVAALGFALESLVVGSATLARLLGPLGALRVGEASVFGGLTFALVLAARAAALRVRPVAVVELAALALAVASLVAGHRGGAIHRPAWLADWAWMHGRDPLRVLIALGGATAVTLALTLLRVERGRPARTLLHLVASVALVLLVVLLLPAGKSASPPRALGGALGQRPRSSDGKGSAQLPPSLEFKNDYSGDNSAEHLPVAVVVFHDEYRPPRGVYYFRQTAFSVFNGDRLVADTTGELDHDILANFPTAEVKSPKLGREQPGPPVRARVRTTVSLLTDQIHPFALDAPRLWRPRPLVAAGHFVRAYDVESAAPIVDGSLLGRDAGQNLTARQLELYREPPDDPRYRELADEILAAANLDPDLADDPYVQSVAIAAWLGKQGIYSMRSSHAGTADPTADFLFGDRTGYCVHFAHAAAYLLRALGLPARVAAGYAVDAGRRADGSSLMLRSSDAHAWAEVYLDDFGWEVVDPMPLRSLDPPPPPVDSELQRSLGELARGDASAGRKERAALAPPPKRAIAIDWPRVAWLLVALLVALYAPKLWRRLAPHLAGGRQLSRVAYRAAVDALGEAGLHRGYGETREQFAARLHDVAPALAALTAVHQQAAFGAAKGCARAEVLALLRASVKQVRRRAPPWRLVAGGIDAFSFRRTR